MGILFNCSEPEAITIALEAIKANVGLSNTLSKSRVLLGAYANRLTPVASDWALKESVGPQPMRDDLDPERYYIDFVSSWVNDLNVQLIGGCCGITPEHIAYLQDKLLASNKRTL
jgi:S-methylmethionine-dependent homocysteine/selenocysteine methylase